MRTRPGFRVICCVCHRPMDKGPKPKPTDVVSHGWHPDCAALYGFDASPDIMDEPNEEGGYTR